MHSRLLRGRVVARPLHAVEPLVAANMALELTAVPALENVGVFHAGAALRAPTIVVGRSSARAFGLFHMTHALQQYRLVSQLTVMVS